MVARPIICFVHVPKTAGSTVNRLLRDNRPNGMEHAHVLFKNADALQQRIDDFDWLSAHSRFSNFRIAVLTASNRPRLFYSLVRRPHRQVVSHYNWLMEIARRTPQFYDSHPAPVKAISEKIRAADNTDPTAVIAILQKYRGLFLNSQSTYVVPGRRRDLPDEELRPLLKPYRHLATQDGIPLLIKKMVGADHDGSTRVNTAHYHFDPEVFETPEVRAFLKEHNARDEQLYRIVAEAEASGRKIGA